MSKNLFAISALAAALFIAPAFAVAGGFPYQINQPGTSSRATCWCPPMSLPGSNTIVGNPTAWSECRGTGPNSIIC